jgi:hypothetical protein
MMNFSSYLLSGFVIFGVFAVLVNLVALDVFSPEQYISVLAESTTIDLYPMYLITSSQIFFSTGWSSVEFLSTLGNASHYGC